MQPTGRDYRDFPKMKALLYLSMVREKYGESAVRSARQISRGSVNSYNGVRTLLHRWSQKDFSYTMPDRKTVIKHGFHYVSEVEVLSSGHGHRVRYRILEKGLDFLANAAIKNRYYYLAVDEVTRANAICLTWFNSTVNKWLYIRPPFRQEDFGGSVGCLPASGGGSRMCASMESAFFYANEKLPCKPSNEFRTFVIRSIQRMEQEARGYSS
jgi:hypothetical protein